MTSQNIATEVTNVMAREVLPLFDKLSAQLYEMEERLGGRIERLEGRMDGLEENLQDFKEQQLSFNDWVAGKIERIDTELAVISGQMGQYDAAFGTKLYSENEEDRTEIISRVLLLEKELQRLKTALQIA